MASGPGTGGKDFQCGAENDPEAKLTTLGVTKKDCCRQTGHERTTVLRSIPGVVWSPLRQPRMHAMQNAWSQPDKIPNLRSATRGFERTCGGDAS